VADEEVGKVFLDKENKSGSPCPVGLPMVTQSWKTCQALVRLLLRRHLPRFYASTISVSSSPATHRFVLNYDNSPQFALFSRLFGRVYRKTFLLSLHGILPWFIVGAAFIVLCKPS